MRERTILLALSIFYLMLPATVLAQSADTARQTGEFSLDMIFAFLFLTLGPLKIIGPFARLTKDHDTAFHRKLALHSSVIAMIAALIATTVAVKILTQWHISREAIFLTGGILITIIAFNDIMKQYSVHPPDEQKKPGAVEPPASKLAFSLAFPTIVTPYGIALLILLVMVSQGHTAKIFLLTAVIFVLNYLAMLGANRIMKWPLAVALLGILGAVLGVLQVALGIQAIIGALHLLRGTI